MNPNSDSETSDIETGENHAGTDTVRVSLEIPCDHRFVTLARTAAVGLVAEFDPTVEEADNLRLAVDELLSAVVEASPAPIVRIHYELTSPEPDSTELFVRVVPAEGSGRAAPVDGLTERILDSITSEHRFLPDGSAELRILQSRG